MGREFLKIMDPEDVEHILKKIPIERRIETVPLDDAYKRVLAEDVYAKIDLPPFKRASMDGYAVKAEDTFTVSEVNPVILKLVENVEAGDVPVEKVENGTCIEVATGTPIPEGANGVIMIEFTDKKEDQVYIYDRVGVGQNITSAGSYIRRGELLLGHGTLLTPDKIGVLSAVGLGEALVFVKPRVAVISTGNEIIQSNEELEYGKIYDINSQMISNAVKSCGCTPVYSGIIKDDYEDLKNKIIELLDADVVVTSGGTSAGEGDVLRMVLDGIGHVLVHGIAIKPGKPTIIGKIRDKIIFGLPGYPVSALIIFNVFVCPFLRKMASIENYNQETEALNLKLSKRFHSARGRIQYVLVRIDGDDAIPILKDSGAITALAEADGYFKVPKNVEIVPEGTDVDVVPLRSIRSNVL